KRDGFKQMIEDALAGKIDLIVTKSVSRFARNTVDSLVTIRELKAKGVEVYFEKENIWTLDSKGELLLTIMSSLAQEESRSISENVTWGKRKSAADGKISLGYKQFLGYDKGEKGSLVVNPEQAVLVKRIYREFMQGKTPWMIAHTFSEEKIPTPSGKSTNWRVSVIESILTNEKYKGAALLQKKFTVDYLTKKMKTNEGEVPQYYVEESHEAIIPPDEWDKVQKEFVRRKAMGRSYSGNSIFATKVICEDCGSFFGSKVWNSTSEKYRRTIWQCNNKFKGEQKCSTPHITEETLREAFIEAFNILFCNMDEVIQNCEMIAEQLTDCTSIDEQIYELKQELDVITEMIQKCVQENATTPLSQEEYLKRYQSYVDKYKSKNEELTKLEQDKILKISRGESFKEFIDAFVKVDGYIEEFDDSLWLTTVEKVIVKKNQDLTFRFFNGTEIEVSSKKCNKPKCS
ncbi:MAG: recombinase family protein, partial [Parabacteroides sp.]|nr:recombinase family protein [Parabacteroides sp.]